MDNDTFITELAASVSTPEEQLTAQFKALTAQLKALTDKLDDIEALVEEVLGKLDDLETPYTTLERDEDSID